MSGRNALCGELVGTELRSTAAPVRRADPRRGIALPPVPFGCRPAYCRAMHAVPLALRSRSGSEVKERLEAERRGTAFVLYRDEDGAQRIVGLERDVRTVTIG